MERRTKLNLLSYLITALLLALLFLYVANADLWSQFSGLDYFSLGMAAALTLVTYCCNGLNVYVQSLNVGFRLEKKDVLLLPLAMGLWGMLLPFQGGVAYFAVYLKRKYNIAVSGSFSMSFFVYFLTIFLSGIFGILFALLYRIESFAFWLISLICLVAPGSIFLTDQIFNYIPEEKLYHFLRPVYRFVRRTVHGITLLCRDRKTVGLLLLISFFRTVNLLFYYWWIVRALGCENISVLALLLLNLWNSVSFLIRLTPQNIGLAQVVAGGLFAMIGLSPEQGVIISVIDLAVISAVALVFGTFAAVWQSRSVIRGRSMMKIG